MPVVLNLSADTPQQLFDMLAAFTAAGGATLAEPAEREPPMTPAAPVADAPRRGRPPKAVAASTPAPAPEPAPAPAPAPEQTIDDLFDSAEPPPAYTIDDVKGALQKLSAAKGLNAAKGLLAQYGAARISEVKVDAWAKFIADAEAAMTGAAA